MSVLADNLQTVNRNIEAACRRTGRLPSDVTLIAVSKLQPVSLLREAFEAGQRDFGENYAQELRDKAISLSNLEGLRWHAIGSLQRNKAKYVARYADSFHALCELETAQMLANKREGKPLRVFIEVNVAEETSKSGISVENVPALAEGVRRLPGLELVGLMTMPPQQDLHTSRSLEQNRGHFARLRELARSLGLSELSMGTTGDYEIAIEEGATIVRVGRSIFGNRLHA